MKDSCFAGLISVILDEFPGECDIRLQQGVHAMLPRFQIKVGGHPAALRWEFDDLIGIGSIIHGHRPWILIGCRRSHARRSALRSPHALRPQLLHGRLMGLDQPGDILISVGGAQESMVGRDVQPVLAVQQPKPGLAKGSPRYTSRTLLIGPREACIQNMEPTPVATAG